jgi:hypothetical protein
MKNQFERSMWEATRGLGRGSGKPRNLLIFNELGC